MKFLKINYICCFLLLLALSQLKLDAQKQGKGEGKKQPTVRTDQWNESMTDSGMFLPVSQQINAVKGAVYADSMQCASARAYDLIKRLSFEEKLMMTGGFNRFFFPGVKRLGLRPVVMADAAQGVRLSDFLPSKNVVSTSFPGILALAGTWEPEFAEGLGKAVGEECRAIGVDILLGPSINLQRHSAGGRNFETLGEDPLLAARMVTPYVRAMQSTKVVATAKQLIGNDQEFCRHLANSIISERALREIYLPPWEEAIRNGNVKAIMTGNNMVNGIPCSVHKPLINDILRKEYGFEGLSMTDWQNTAYYKSMQHLTITSGQSVLMNTNATFAQYVDDEIKKTPERKAEFEIMLGAMIYPSLYTLFESGVYDRTPVDEGYKKTYEAHKEFARKYATEAICLLKNDGNILPLKKSQKILLMGTEEISCGVGSGAVKGYDHISFSDALKNEYGDNFTMQEKPDDKTIRSADVVLFRLNKEAGEGNDIPFEEPVNQIQELIRISKLNRNVVVIISSGNPMPMPWLNQVKGVVWAYFLGQERGFALVNILSGKVSPSGKLPFTIEKSWADSPDPDFNFLGGKPYWYGHNSKYRSYFLGLDSTTDNTFHLYVKPQQFVDIPYDEGIFIGYRWYDSKNKPVQFPFGYGLSYTSFAYSGIAIDNTLEQNGFVSISFEVKNTGKVAGKEVVQLYVAPGKSSVPRPLKELKGFEKFLLQPGESKRVSLKLTKRDFSYWDEDSHSWKAEPGAYEILVGASSADIRLKTNFQLN